MHVRLDWKATLFRLLGAAGARTLVWVLKRRRTRECKDPVRHLQKVFFEITRTCPLNCSMCYVRQELAQHSEECTTDQAVQLCLGHKLKEVTLTGGEPLWRADTPEIAKRLAAAGYRVNILTSGNVNPRIDMHSLTEIPGLSVCLSIDGPPELHDAIRGRKGCLHASQQFLRSISPPVPVGAQTLLQSANISKLREIIVTCREFAITRLTLSFERFSTEQEMSATMECLKAHGFANPSRLVSAAVHPSLPIAPEEFAERIMDAIFYGAKIGILVFPLPVFFLDHPEDYLAATLRKGKCMLLESGSGYYDAGGRRIICTNLRIEMPSVETVDQRTPEERLVCSLRNGRLLPLCRRCCNAVPCPT